MTTIRELADELNMTVPELQDFAPHLPWEEGSGYVIPEEEAEEIRGAIERQNETTQDI